MDLFQLLKFAFTTVGVLGGTGIALVSKDTKGVLSGASVALMGAGLSTDTHALRLVVMGCALVLAIGAGRLRRKERQA